VMIVRMYAQNPTNAGENPIPTNGFEVKPTAPADITLVRCAAAAPKIDRRCIAGAVIAPSDGSIR
jgi:hypothetical protein